MCLSALSSKHDQECISLVIKYDIAWCILVTKLRLNVSTLHKPHCHVKATPVMGFLYLFAQLKNSVVTANHIGEEKSGLPLFANRIMFAQFLLSLNAK